MKINLVGSGEISVEASSVIDILKIAKAKNTVAAKVNGVTKDLFATVRDNDTIEFITKDSPEGLEILRHSCAHITAMAVQELYPEARFAIGPVIDNGYYYDIKLDKALSIDDLEAIQAKMQDIIDAKLRFSRRDVSKQEARDLFKDNPFKLELIEGIPDETVSVYYIGDPEDKGRNFCDLCRGPHIPSTSSIDQGAFKLQDVSGSYWRGDSKGEKLQRIYGTAFASKKELQDHLTMIEEAKKRDHRKLGPALDLFLLNDSAAGSVFWLRNGHILFQQVKDTISDLIRRRGYFLVQTPVILSRRLWEQSGHWDKFHENMFVVADSDENQMAIKPMNCPGHVIVYQHGEVKSYRSLPYRVAEFGMCHRNEPSGALHGLMRLRQFTQDDGHVFCTPDQIVGETIEICSMIKELYGKFGFHDISIKFSTRPEKRAGSDEIWDKAEEALRVASEAAGLHYTINEGEGAFYGPKLEFVLKDSLGRDWQCGTLQVDFVLPERFGLTYVDCDGVRKQPVILHRALAGSLERFCGIVIEHYGGALPFWLAPVQVCIASIHEDQVGYCESVRDRLEKLGVRCVTDYSKEKISYKVNDASMKKIPYILVCGAKEAEGGTVSVRRFGSMTTDSMRLEEFVGVVRNNQNIVE